MVPDIVKIKRLCSSGQWLTRIENGKVLLHDTVSGETVCVGQTSAEPVIRCNICKHYETDTGYCYMHDHGMNLDDFCSRGEKVGME